MPCLLKPSLEQAGNLGPDAARAGNRRSGSAARCAGCGGIGKTLESPRFRRFRRCTGRLNATQPGVLAVSPLYIRGLGPPRKGSVASRQHTDLIGGEHVKLQLTLRFYCGKTAARRHRDSVSGRANQGVLLGIALVCASASLCLDASVAGRAESQASGPITATSIAATPVAASPVTSPATASNVPVASEARLAGDASKPRFVLDLDKAITFRAFALADPYRVIVDIPQ